MKKHLAHLLRRGATIIIGFTVVLSASGFTNPRPAHAQWVTIDPVNLIQNIWTVISTSAMEEKEFILDTLAWQVAKMAIQSLTKSLVNWINSGFQGSPAFITDLETNLQGVDDAAADHFFKTLASQEIAKTPEQERALDLVRTGYYLSTSPESFYTKNPYTLNKVSSNDSAFLQGNFKEGGWNAWFVSVMNPQNNPYGAQKTAEDALSNAVSAATAGRLQELSWNKGFLSWRGECIDKAPANSSTQNSTKTTDLSGKDACANYEVLTPGSVIQEQLTKQLGSTVDQLVTADEFNEIIGALLNQFVIQAMGADGGGGLRGTSKPKSGGGKSSVDQATDPSNTNGGGLSTTFKLRVDRQKEIVTKYQQRWTRIRDIAKEALARCGNHGDPTPQEVIERSAAPLARAANALTELDKTLAALQKVEETPGNQTNALVEVSTAYQALLDSDKLLTPEEIAEAEVESQDLDQGDSLYTSMKKMAEATNTRECNGD